MGAGFAALLVFTAFAIGLLTATGAFDGLADTGVLLALAAAAVLLDDLDAFATGADLPAASAFFGADLLATGLAFAAALAGAFALVFAAGLLPAAGFVDAAVDWDFFVIFAISVLTL